MTSPVSARSTRPARSAGAALAVVVTAAAVALAGCSSTSAGKGTPANAATAGSSTGNAPAIKPADAETFVQESLDAFLTASTAHVSGTVTSDGKDITLDIKYGKVVAIGTLTIGGQQVEISRVADGSSYFKAGAAFWESGGAPDSAVATLADKYVEVSADTSGFSDFASLLDREKFAEGVRPSSGDLDGVEITGPTEVRGISCYGVEDSDKSGAFYAAASSPPLPVELTSKGDGELHFDGYGDTVDVPTPDPSQVVQLPGS